jgi:hypothetical protein
MNSMDRILGKLTLNKFQRLLLFGSASVWLLFAVISMKRNFQDSWILEGVFWPFLGFIVIFLFVLWKEDDNRLVAVLCSWAVITILLIPSLKYTQVYGQTLDSIVHYQMIKNLMTLGRTSPNIYQSIAGMHSWMASMGLTSGLSAADIVKLGFPLSGGIYPLLVYWICRRTSMPTDLTKYIVCLSCLAVYPYHQLTGTGFTLVPLMMFLGGLLVREYYCSLTSEKFIYTLLALVALVQLTVWHSTTPLLLLVLLVGVSFTPILVWLVTGRKKAVRINTNFLRVGLLAVILNIGYHTIEIDPVFRVVFLRLYELLIAENQPAAIVPASVASLSLIEMIRVFLVLYGREALMFGLAASGFLVIWRNRNRFDRWLPSYAYWAIIIGVFPFSLPLSLLGVDFERLLWIPLAISPLFAGFAVWWWNQRWVSRSRPVRWLGAGIGFLLTLAAVGLFAMEFFIYQPMIPKSKTLSPDTPDEYAFWAQEVNTAYQKNMISFAESFSNPETRFDIDILGNRQYIRYYGGTQNRGLFLPLAPYMKWIDHSNNPNEKLFLLHWPGRAGGYAEQVRYRSVKYLTKMRDTEGWGLIYDNGESYILEVP